jgi:hypothetical protein
MTAPTTTRAWAAAVALAVATAAVFAPTVRNGFVNYDDPDYVSENPVVLGGLSIEGVTWAFLTLNGGFWMPTTWLSLQFDVTVFGPDPAGFHATNVALHAANAGLLFLVLRRLTGAAGRSFAAALLWAVHPLRVESVAWVTERKDVLSGLFFLLTVAAYLRFVHTRSGGWLYGALGLYATGLAAKPMLVTLPFVLLLLDAWPLCRLRSVRDLRRLAWEKAPFFLLAVVFSVITALAQRDLGVPHSLTAHPIEERVSVALTGYGTYLWQTVWPAGLAGLYPITPLPVWRPVAAGALLAVVTTAAVALRRRAPYLAVGWFWFLGMLFPVCGVAQAGPQTHADRFTYLPHIGLLLAVVWAAAAVADRLRAPTALRWVGVAVVAAACVVQTERQIPHWADNRAFWERAVAANPSVPWLHLVLARVCLKEGDYDATLAHAEEAYRLSGYAQPFLEQRGILIAAVERHRSPRK